MRAVLDTHEACRLVLRRGLVLTALGVALGAVGAVALRSWVEPFLFGVEPTDPVTFGVIVGLVALVSVAACVAPAGRATLVDPMESLRSE